MGKSLYSIEDEYKDILRLVEEADGEMSAELVDKLTINEKELERKCKGYHHVMRYIQAWIDADDKEVERLTALNEARQKGLDRLHGNLLKALLAFGEEDKKSGVKRLKYDTLELSTIRSKGGVNVHKVEEIETKYCNSNITIKKLPVDVAIKLEERFKKTLEQIKEYSYKRSVEELKESSVSKTVAINKTLISNAIKDIIKKNEARKTLDPDAELEPEEVPGANMHPDTIKLVIK